MNKFTLVFHNQIYEREYRKYNNELIRGQFTITMGMPILFFSYHIFGISSEQSLMDIMLFIILVICLLLYYLLIRNREIIVDYTLSLYSFFIVTMYTLIHIKGDNLNFQLGFGMCFLQQRQLKLNKSIFLSLLIGSRFYLKGIFQLANIIIFAYYDMTESEYDMSKLAFIIFGLLNLYMLYCNDRNKRFTFLLDMQNQKWRYQIDRALDISVITLGFQKKFDRIEFINSNKSAKEFFKVQDDDSFRQFARNLRSIKQDENQRVTKINIEKFIYQLFKKLFQKELKLDDLIDNSYYFDGLYEQQFLNLRIFLYLQNDPVIVLLIQQKNNDQQLQAMKNKGKLYYTIIKNILTKFTTSSNNTLSYLQRFKQICDNGSKMISYSIMQQNLYHQVMEAQNYKLYFKTDSYHLKYTNLSLLNMLKRVFFIFQSTFLKKKVQLKVINLSSNNPIVETDQYYLFHSLLLLVEYCITLIDQNTKFNILINQKYNNILGFYFYQVSFSFKGKIEKNTFDNLPYKNTNQNHIIQKKIHNIVYLYYFSIFEGFTQIDYLRRSLETNWNRKNFI